MLKKTVTYTDYNGLERTEDFYFNLSKAELMDMEMGTTGGMTEMLNRIIDSKDTPAIAKMFKELLMKSYGEKSADGKRFVKSEEISKAFSETEAYSQIYMELLSIDGAAAEFTNGILPADLAAAAKAKQTGQSNVVSLPTSTN